MAKTVAEFVKTFTDEDAALVYYVDDDGHMWLLRECDCYYDTSQNPFCDSIKDAVLLTYKEALVFMHFCNYLFDEEFHIVTIHNIVSLEAEKTVEVPNDIQH